jgi:glycosyltransferase involved in cell wall biosynthesis
VSDEVLRAYYRVARLFVCASEHEGFCVPLAEAMAFGLPTIALDRGAVGETMGDSGVLLSTWDPQVVAETAAALLESPMRRAELAAVQQLRLCAFSRAAVTHRVSAVVSYLRDGAPSPLFYRLSPRPRSDALRRPAAAVSEELHSWSTLTS